MRRLFERAKVLGFTDEPMLSVYRDLGVIPKDEAVNPNKTAEDRSIYQLVDNGWLVVNRMKAWQGAVAISNLRGILSGHYICFRPIHEENDRFLHYLLRSPRMTAHFLSISRGVRPGQIEIDNDDLAATRIKLPDLQEQRRIADFIDDRVARIDQMIAARRAQIRLGQETLDAAWAERAERLENSFGLTPIRRFLMSIVDGPFGSSLTSSHYSDSGTRVIRLGNIGLATFRSMDAAFIPDEYGLTLKSHAVLPGDLIMAGLGDDRWPLGRCTVAPADIGPAIVKADCYRIRLEPSIRHDYAAAFLSSPPARQRAILLARGATRARLNTEIARAAQVPPATVRGQHLFVAALAAEQENADRVTHQLGKSVELLVEYKSSLVAAAIAGDLDVTTAGSSIPK